MKRVKIEVNTIAVDSFIADFPLPVIGNIRTGESFSAAFYKAEESEVDGRMEIGVGWAYDGDCEFSAPGRQEIDAYLHSLEKGIYLVVIETTSHSGDDNVKVVYVEV